MIRGLGADLRHALRLYRATPAASLIAVVVLAIGMAFVAAFVSLYVDLILRPHPGFEQGGGIVTYGWNNGQNAGGLPLDLIERVQEEAVTLDAAAGVGAVSFQIGEEQESAYAEIVSTEFFEGLRPRLALGSGLDLTHHTVDAEPVIVISHQLWQSRFEGREDIIGRTMPIWSNPVTTPGPNGPEQGESEPTDFRIVGVMSPRFVRALAAPGQPVAAYWMPVERAIPLMMGVDASVASYTGQLRGLGRRAGGASSEVIRNELEAKFATELADRINLTGIRFDVIDGFVYNVFQQRSTQRQLWLFLGASILLALVASANVSLFLLARAPGRRRELAIRMSVGAPMRRLAKQLASEATLLVVAGAVIGIVLSIWLAEYLRNLALLRDAQWRSVTLLDWRVLALVGGFLLLLSLFVSLAPILGLRRLGIAASSRQVPARATAAQWIAGTLQITIAGTLTGAAIAFAWYLGSMLLLNAGFNTRDMYVAQMTAEIIDDSGRQTNASTTMIDYARRREVIMTIPGVSNAAFGTAVPGMTNGIYNLGLPHPEDANRTITMRAVGIDAHFARLVDFNLLHGRHPTEEENGVALVNQALARDVWGRDDVVGELLPFSLSEAEGTEIVGVLEDLSYGHPDDDVEPMVLLAIDLPIPESIAVIESELSRTDLQRELEGLIETGALEVSLMSVDSANSIRTEVLAADRARGLLTIGETVLVVLLAAAGFYGTQRYLVAAGRREYAIRASLGAGPSALSRLVFRRGLLLGLPGLILSLPLAFILVSWLYQEDYLRGDYSIATVTFIVAGVALGLLALMAVASIGPSLQARRTQPAPLLREE